MVAWSQILQMKGKKCLIGIIAVSLVALFLHYSADRCGCGVRKHYDTVSWHISLVKTTMVANLQSICGARTGGVEGQTPPPLKIDKSNTYISELVKIYRYKNAVLIAIKAN